MIKWAFNFRAWQPTRSEWIFCGQCIQNEEKDRIQRFVFKKDAKAAMVGRLLIRKVIADCLKIPYQDIRLGRTEKGKPFLENHGHENFSFNVSHHGDFAVLAASTEGLVGVDVMKYEVMYIDPWLMHEEGNKMNETSVPSFFHTMRRQFTESEWIQIKKSEEESQQLKTFYRLWCLKESYVKALGTGIGFDISRVSFDFKTDFLQENTVTMDTSMKVDGVYLPEWIFEEHSLNNHCIVVAQNQKNSSDNSKPATISNSFELLSLNDLIECVSPLTDSDEGFWENFEPKDESPQIRQKNSA